MMSSHEELLAEIDRTVTSNSEEQRSRRILALEGLLQTLADPSRTIEVLCAMLKTVGAIEPESTLVLKYLRRATKRDEHALETLIRLVIERQEGAIGCGYRLLPALGVKAQARLGHALAKELFQRDVRDHPT